MTNSLLWKVTSLTGCTSYLLGTMHVKNNFAFHNFEFLQSYIDQQSFYYAEMDLSPDPDQTVVQQHFLPNGLTLFHLLGERKFSRLHRMIEKSFQVDLISLNPFYPMIAAHIILDSIFTKVNVEILDQALYRYAVQKGKNLSFLESREDQIKIFQTIPLDLQLKQLRDLGRNPSRARKHYQNLCRWYSDHQTRMLYLQSARQLGKLRKTMLYQRNEKMTEKLSKNLHHQDAFIAVGAAHLFGYKGILRLLKHRGFKVEAIAY